MTDIKYLNYVRFWNDENRQDALNYLKENKEAKYKFLDAVRDLYKDGKDYCNDEAALNYIVATGEESSFNRFDSDVAETFIWLFKKLFLNK